jgi:hypothetical protein
MCDWHFWVMVALLASNVWVVANISNTVSEALNKLGDIESQLGE